MTPFTTAGPMLKSPLEHRPGERDADRPRRGARWASHHVANRIVGWATDPRATTTLVLTALNHALRSREVRAGQLIHHSDKGSQYTALRFTQRLLDAGVAPSTGSTDDSYDNALAENLWSTIKVELVYWPGTAFATRAEAEHALVRYIDGWYNPRRIQASLGGLSPDEYEDAYYRAQRHDDHRYR